MTFLAGIAARIIGPKLIAAIPWRLIAVLLLLAGIASAFWALDDAAYKRGALHERATWQAAAVKAADAAHKVALARDAAVARADAANTARLAAVAALAAKNAASVKEYYRANPAANRNCLSADRMRAIADADRAATAAANAASLRAVTLHGSSLDRRR